MLRHICSDRTKSILAELCKLSPKHGGAVLDYLAFLGSQMGNCGDGHLSQRVAPPGSPGGAYTPTGSSVAKLI